MEQDGPPSYTAVDSQGVPPLPAVRSRTEHVYHLTNSKKSPWATLKVRSMATSPTSLPSFGGQNAVTGTLEVDTKKMERIHTINLLVSCVTIQVNVSGHWR
jgi:hypothetical protein